MASVVPSKKTKKTAEKGDIKWGNIAHRFLPHNPEYYYKETGELSGKGKYLKDIAKRNIEDLKKLRKNFKDLTKT